MNGRDYRDLIASKKAFNLTLAIYRNTAHFPSEEKYGIAAQLRRAGVSIPSNIAEGQGRKSNNEFVRFLTIALGLSKEVETQILISDSLGYFRSNEASELLTQTAEVSRLINGLIRSLRNRD
jgi:four helix bundle protein